MEIKKKLAWSGFTLVELLVSLSILAILSTAVVSSFVTTLGRSAKVKVLKDVETDGKYAIRVMERMIRAAEEIEGSCEANMSSLTIKNTDGGITEFNCNSLISGRRCLASNSANPANAACLISPGSQVAIEEGRRVCRFDCSQGEAEGSTTVGNPVRVGIDFKLKQSGTTTRVEEEAVLNFETTVTLRNYRY